MSTVSSSKNTIALNGKIYDVTTGNIVKKLLPSQKAAPQKTHKVHKTQPHKSHKLRRPHHANIDGIMPAKSAAKAGPKPAHQPAKDATKSAVKPRAGGQHIKHHQAQKARTLMRSSVKKPQAGQGPSISKVQGPVGAGPKSAVHQRLQRSAVVPMSKAIHKFKPSQHAPVIKKSVPLSVKQPGQTTPAKTVATTAAPKPQASAAVAKPAPAENMFTEAIKKATSHELPRLKRRQVKKGDKKLGLLHSRLAKIIAISIVTLTVLGTLAWYFAPNLQIRVASLRAGFTASLPAYTPSGFGVQGFDYKTGEVSINYQSNSDQRQFAITQKASNWNSETLLSSYLTPTQQEYQTYQDQGKTIYIYNGTNATWVDGGIWYRIEGNSSLSNDQLLRIANSF